mgnify:CR=1 FL=1
MKEMDDDIFLAEGTTVVPTTLHAGNTTNTVPDLAVLDIDIRSYSMDDLKRVDAAIKTIRLSERKPHQRNFLTVVVLVKPLDFQKGRA